MSAPTRVRGIRCRKCRRTFASFTEFENHDCDGDDREVPA